MNYSTRVEELNYGRAASTLTNTRASLQALYLSFCLRYFSFFKLDISNSSPFLSLVNLRNKGVEESSLSISNSLALKYTRDLPSLASSIPLVNSRKYRRQASSITTTLASPRVLKKVKTYELVALSSLTSSTTLLSNLLTDFLGNPSATFRIVEQELLLNAILLKIPYILGVLPTSSGKSLTYLLASALSTSTTTIVIVPLVGLKLDLIRRAEEFNIPISIYEEIKDFKALTLISIETILNTSFLEAIRSLIESSKLDRIVVDEAHLLITTKSYRSSIFKFKQVFIYSPIPFIFLTGTLPRSLEKELISFLELKSLTTIRALTSREDISFRTKVFRSLEDKSRFLEVKDSISSFRKREYLTSRDKYLIFCPSINEAITLASFLECIVYTSKLSVSERESVLKGFRESNLEFFSILVSTSALEEGFDYSSIRLVVYYRSCFSFLGFLQGSSRGGRDNSTSTSLFFYSKGEELERESEPEDKALFRAYLRERTCRRRVISLYLDSKVVDTCSNTSTKCDLCFNRSNILEAQATRVLESNKTIESFRVAVIDYIRVLETRCLFYSLLKGEGKNKWEESLHEASTCPLYSTKAKWASIVPFQEFKEFRASLSKDSCYFKCLLPTIVCFTLRDSSLTYKNYSFL